MKRINIYLALLLVVFSISSCKKDEQEVVTSDSPTTFDGEFTRQWINLECTIVKTTGGFLPPQAARAYGYTGIALYESIVQGWPEAKSLAGQINGLTEDMLPKIEENKEYNWALSANAAMAEIIRKMYEKKISADNLAEVNTLENNWQSTLSYRVSEEVAERSIAYGKSVANAIYEYSKTDGGHESYMDPFQLPYTWPAITGAWIPTGATANPIAPKWGSNRPFLASNLTNIVPVAHPAYSTDPASPFYQEAMNVYNTVTNASEEQKTIARYWADDPMNTCTPTGHTFNIMMQLLEENDANLAMSAVAFAKLGIAENDAFICCWKCKYDYFLIRPVTYIKQNIDPNFATVIGTPAFPAYTSGHATEAAAGTEIFKNMFANGNANYNFTDRSQVRYGFSTRTFTNFDDMALECANSRLYGGIHYNFDNMKGLEMGRTVGENVINSIDWPTTF
ncbi:MAG: vanadium-dependent haloperoxidase [Chitinophagales bacterium]|nr:vanadium-dependent haloperoxidase [Chitinophagales bacterium]